MAAALGTLWFAARRSRLVLPGLGAVALTGWFVMPMFVSGGSGRAESGAGLTVTHLNIDLDHVDALDHLAEQDSDIVFVQEFTSAVAEAFADRLPAYEIALANPSDDSTHGSAMLIRDDWDGTVFSAEIVNIPPTSRRPLILAEVGWQGETVSLLSLHTTRPGHAAVYYGQQEEFAGVADWSRQLIEDGGTVVIIGDFNTTPYASNFRSLLSNGNLRNGLRGQGWQTTWPASVPSVFQIPIDLMVHSNDVVVHGAEAGPNLGPDHRPLTVELAVK